MALGFAAVPAVAAPPPQPAYVALGDSYAAGQGALPYTSGACFVSRKGYPEIADNHRALELTANAACSGATTQKVLDEQLSQVPASTNLVTVTVGGNDLDTTGLLATCFTVPADCEQAAAEKGALLQKAMTNPDESALVQGLASVSLSIRNKVPNAKIVFTGYPMLFDPAFPDPRATRINELTAGLNSVIAAVAPATGALYVDVAPAFAGHGIGSGAPWINYDAANIFAPANFHPNGEGYRHGYYASMVGTLTNP
jgi:lysophospholipase L1-like esterase